ncbi:NASP-related protein sim3 [Trifolium repens]|nr:NASP-related protein sim3 [Trifolium repens]KAK2418062.1 NASP-related protein sim3 [Trifolium repens]
MSRQALLVDLSYHHMKPKYHSLNGLRDYAAGFRNVLVEEAGYKAWRLRWIGPKAPLRPSQQREKKVQHFYVQSNLFWLTVRRSAVPSTLADEGDEAESDLDLAWKMLDIARAIKKTILKHLSHYQKALSVLEQLVEPDDRNIADINFRICLCLEARLHRLTNEVKSFSDASSTSKLEWNEAEIETLTGLASELEKKLDDLQQLATANSSRGFFNFFLSSQQ